MLFQLKSLVKYILWWLGASNGKGHGMHSPFVFDFITNVLNDDREFYAFQQIENTAIQTKSARKINRLLFRMVDYYQPKNIINIEKKETILVEYLSTANHSIPIKTMNTIDDVVLKSVMEELLDVGFVVCDSSNLSYDFLSFTNNDSFVIIKSIYSNDDAEKSWNEIKAKDTVKATIDLFDLGIVLFNPNFKVKQHFKVRF